MSHVLTSFANMWRYIGGLIELQKLRQLEGSKLDTLSIMRSSLRQESRLLMLSECTHESSELSRSSASNPSSNRTDVPFCGRNHILIVSQPEHTEP